MPNVSGDVPRSEEAAASESSDSFTLMRCLDLDGDGLDSVRCQMLMTCLGLKDMAVQHWS